MGYPAAFLRENLHNYVPNRKSPLNRNYLFGLNRSVFEIKRFKRYFLKMLTLALWEMGFWIRKKAIRAQIEPRIVYLSGLAKYPENTRIPELSDTFQPPVMANTPGVFDRTGGHFHLIGAPIEVSQQSGAGKCPDSGFLGLQLTRIF